MWATKIYNYTVGHALLCDGYDGDDMGYNAV